MVVRAAGPPGQRIILYDYIPSRTREALKQLLVRPEGPYTGLRDATAQVRACGAEVQRVGRHVATWGTAQQRAG